MGVKPNSWSVADRTESRERNIDRNEPGRGDEQNPQGIEQQRER
jgi:hypothetical protein